jgi:hypothetical protein
MDGMVGYGMGVLSGLLRTLDWWDGYDWVGFIGGFWGLGFV